MAQSLKVDDANECVVAYLTEASTSSREKNKNGTLEPEYVINMSSITLTP